MTFFYNCVHWPTLLLRCAAYTSWLAGWLQLAACSSALGRWLPGCMVGRYSDVAGVSLSD